MLSRAVRVARIRGVEVRLAPSLVVLAALLIWLLTRRFEAAYGTGTAVVMALAGSLLFFGSILVHEFGHASEARRRGIPVRGITLLLVGGVTEMHHESRSPRDEFAIAAIGPYLSLVTAAFAHVGGVVATRLLDPATAAPIAEVALLLAGLNVLLAVFNLVPGAPLDGGRILRAALWALWGDRHRAVIGAARAGQAFALVVIGFGVVELSAGLQVASIGGIWWAVLGLFLFRGATAELQHGRTRAAMEGRTAAEAIADEDAAARSRGAVPADAPEVAVDAPFDDLVRAHVAGADLVRLTDLGVTIAVVSEADTARALRAFERRPSPRRRPRDDVRTPA